VEQRHTRGAVAKFECLLVDQADISRNVTVHLFLFALKLDGVRLHLAH
jgi:hypothetical protein